MALQPELPEAELLRMEKEVAGLYLSGHPMQAYAGVLARLHLPRIAEVIEGFRDNVPGLRDGETVTVAGLVSQIRVKATKNASMMAYVTIEDTTAALETLLFSRTLQNAGGLLKEGAAVRLTGRLSGREEEDPKIVADTVLPLDAPEPQDAQSADAGAVSGDPENPKKLWIRFTDANRNLFDRTMALLRVFHGTIPVMLYDENTKEARDAGRPQYFMASPVLYKALRELLGADNVIVK